MHKPSIIVKYATYLLSGVLDSDIIKGKILLVLH